VAVTVDHTNIPIATSAPTLLFKSAKIEMKARIAKGRRE
jgi:hypothetical protein